MMSGMMVSRWTFAYAIASTVFAFAAVSAAQTAAPPPAASVSAEVSASAAVPPASDYDYEADTDASALTAFREQLSSHGTWVDDAKYGTVWVPNSAEVGPEFAPYRTAGRWAVGDDGEWLWQSDYDWGYIPFHYGRWVWLTARGWSWIPGRVYAPAWVMWRTGSVGYDYVGWAPMPPSYIWMNGYAVGYGWGASIPWWFCPTGYFFSPYWRNYIVRDRVVVQRIVQNTNVHYGHGGHGGGGGAGGGGHLHAHAVVNGKTPYSASGKVYVAARPQSPSLAAAGIPAASAPKIRGSHDARAIKLQLPSNWRATQAVPATARAVGSAAPASLRPRVVYATRSNPAPRNASSFAPNPNRGYPARGQSSRTFAPSPSYSGRSYGGSSYSVSRPSGGSSQSVSRPSNGSSRSVSRPSSGSSQSVSRPSSGSSQSVSRPSSSGGSGSFGGGGRSFGGGGRSFGGGRRR